MITVNLIEKIELSPKELRVLRQLSIRNSREYIADTGKELLKGLVNGPKNLVNETHTFHGSDFDRHANCKALRKSAIVFHRPMVKVYLNSRGERVVALLKKRGIL